MDKEAFEALGKKFLAKNKKPSFVKKGYFNVFSPVITSKCNLGCTYCFGKEKKREEKTSNWEILSAGIKYIGQQNKEVHVMFSSAGEQTTEPTLLKKTLGSIEKKLKIARIKFSTNGATNPKFLTDIADRMGRFQVSCDGPPEIQNRQRPLRNGGKSSATVEKTIKTLVKNNKEFMVKTTLTSNHVGREEQTFKYFYNLEVPVIVFSTVSDLGAGCEFIKTSERNKWAVLADSQMKLKEFCDSFGLKSRLAVEHYFEYKGKTQYCSVGNYFCLGTDGTVSGCLMYSNTDDLKIHQGMKQLVLGCFNRKKGFLMDWKKIKKLRSYYKKSECYDCDFKLCWGGCPLKNLEKNNNMAKPDRERCLERKTQTLQLMKYLAERDVIKIKPYLSEKSEKLYYSMQFSEFELSTEISKNSASGVFLKFDPAKADLEKLAKKIVEASKKHREKIRLFVLCPITRGRLGIRDSIRFKAFLYSLKKNKVIFKISRPVKITDANAKKEKEFYEEFFIPKNCLECLELFKEKNGEIEYCGGVKGPKISEFFDRNEIYSEFKKTSKKSQCPWRE
ncbi:MAG: radical SAM protein [Candidatus Diapherotrites archaeon]